MQEENLRIREFHGRFTEETPAGASVKSGGSLMQRREIVIACRHFALAGLYDTEYDGGMSTMLAEKVAFISVGEAAAIIGCTEPHVRLLLSHGLLEGQKLNERAWAVRKVSAEKYAKTPRKTGRPRSRE